MTEISRKRVRELQEFEQFTREVMGIELPAAFVVEGFLEVLRELVPNDDKRDEYARRAARHTARLYNLAKQMEDEQAEEFILDLSLDDLLGMVRAGGAKSNPTAQGGQGVGQAAQTQENAG